ncbi:MAG: rod shape-determining protein MreC [Gaiellaceae bacterium]
MGHATKARLVAALLVLVSLGLITIYFRESSEGELHTAQRIGVSILAPFEAAGERVARPFRDAWAWTADVLDAKEENEELRKENEALRDQAIRNETAAQENQRLRELLGYLAGPSFPDDYRGVVSRVIARPPSPYQQYVLVNAGTEAGVRKGYPVVSPSGLVGLVTEVTPNTAKVTLLTDQGSNVSAIVLESSAAGVVQQGASGGSLILDRVGKDELVEEGNLVVTAGWQTLNLESLYPRGIPIGTVESVGQQDVDLYKRIQVAPLVDFDSLAEVIVLVPIERKEEPAAQKPAKKTKKS